MAAAAALLLVCTGCSAVQPEEVSFYQTGSVFDSAALLRWDEDWYLEAGRTENGLPAVRLKSSSTGETAAMAAVENDGEIADAIYRNGSFYITATNHSENKAAIDYTVYKVSNSNSELLLQGECGNYLSQAPVFAHLKDGTVLVVQDHAGGLGLYRIPDHVFESVQELSVEDTALISVTPKIYNNKIALFAESEAGARLLVYDIDFSAGEASVCSEVPFENGAGMIDYALSEEELIICQQTADSAGIEPEYELCVYQLAAGELVQRESLGKQPVYPVCGLKAGSFLCQDDGGSLFVIRSDRLGARHALNQMGNGPFAVSCSGGVYYIVSSDGVIYAVDVQAPVQSENSSSAPMLSYTPNHTSENQYVNEAGLQVLISYNNDLLPTYQAEMIYAVYEPGSDRFRFQLSYLQDGRRYFLESSFRWSDQALLAYSINEYQQGLDASLPASVLQPLTEHHLLSIAQTLYADLAAHCSK